MASAERRRNRTATAPVTVSDSEPVTASMAAPALGPKTAATILRARTQPRAARGTFEPREGEQKWMQPYIDELIANCGQVVAACKTAKVARSTVARYRSSDPVFETAEKKAMQMSMETAESEAKRRAVHGVESVEIRTWTDKDGNLHKIERRETKYSDTIMLRLLERLETGTWRQKQQIEHSGGMTFKTRAERKAALEQARAARQQEPVTAANGRS